VTNFKRKEVDDVLGGEKAWENVDQTDGGTISWTRTIDRANEFLDQPCVQSANIGELSFSKYKRGQQTSQ
jgi:hypothetical protein